MVKSCSGNVQRNFKAHTVMRWRLLSSVLEMGNTVKRWVQCTFFLCFLDYIFLTQADKQYRTRMNLPFIHPEDAFICFQHILAQILGFWSLLKVAFLKGYREDFLFFQELLFVVFVNPDSKTTTVNLLAFVSLVGWQLLRKGSLVCVWWIHGLLSLGVTGFTGNYFT